VPRVYRDVDCIGTESHFSLCNKTLFSGVSCATSGVVCQGMMQVELLPPKSTVYLCTTAESTSFANCSTGEVQLALQSTNGSAGSVEGRLELCINDAWGTICDTFFDARDASVACSLLNGFSSQGVDKC